MRASLVLGLCVLLSPAMALAQTAASPPAAAPSGAAPAAPEAAPHDNTRSRGGDITRDEYIARAVERAKRAAEKRFDKMDSDHNGVLTAAERRAAREERRRQRDEQSQ